MGSGCRANCGRFEAGTTVDLRIGFNGVSMSVEPRVTLSYVSLGGGHTLIFSPDVNFLKPMGTITSHKGLYLTAGGTELRPPTPCEPPPDCSTTPQCSSVLRPLTCLRRRGCQVHQLPRD